MKTTIKKRPLKRREKNSSATLPIINEGEFKQIPIEKIDLSPLNYRKFYSETELQEFAKELALHGIISPVTVRVHDRGRYELVVGERRYKAAQIAKMKHLPARVCSLADEEVIEIQLCENLQRENPHPMYEAQAIGQMQKANKSIDEIAAGLENQKHLYMRGSSCCHCLKRFRKCFLLIKSQLMRHCKLQR